MFGLENFINNPFKKDQPPIERKLKDGANDSGAKKEHPLVSEENLMKLGEIREKNGEAMAARDKEKPEEGQDLAA